MQAIARQGETLDAIAWRHYGRTAGVVEAVLEANPGLAALGPQLPLGTAVELPDIAPATEVALVQLWD